ncbi:SDR family NAD(P)-dependent oxidoreductase [Shewanella youngdeokensis]|uniref:SDR family NAD(P)-dependent oxidoreductase n=1 Tax=Shewanella youngdeokensis TaxID=2999068 RepID=A0ABZ0K012_9GAMM|nr:SDR family NAD(P)-dependent oxidoreductase [Shewanella sp. DAU334]
MINNAGTGHPGLILKSNLEDEKNVLRLNSITPMELAHYYGNQMIPKSRGGIIFVSSAMGYQGTPYMANYSASKAYTLTLRESIYHELKGRGVDVLVISPGATNIPAANIVSNTNNNHQYRFTSYCCIVTILPIDIAASSWLGRALNFETK